MPVRVVVEPSRGHTSDRTGNRGCTSTCCRFLTGKSSGGVWAQPELRGFSWGWELGAGWHSQVAWASSRQEPRAREPETLQGKCGPAWVRTLCSWDGHPSWPED